MSTAIATPVRVGADALIKEQFPHEAGGGSVASFAADVKKSLNYEVPSEIQFREGKVPTLLTLFKEHGFSLYRPEEVAVYQEQQAKRAQSLANRSRRLGVISFYFLTICSIVILGAIGTTASGVEFSEASGFASFCGIVAIVIGCFVVVSPIITGTLDWKRATWQSYRFNDSDDDPIRDEQGWSLWRIDSYDGVLPKSALQAMLNVKKAIPNAEFRLAALRVEHPRVLDPIMFAYLPEEVAFQAPIAIWDEPDFNGQLIDAANL